MGVSPAATNTSATERAAFATGYPARDVAKLLGLSMPQIRSYVRAGFVTPQRDRHGEERFSFQDMVVLRTGKALQAELPARKVRRALMKLKEQLPKGRQLSAVRIMVDGDSIVVRDDASVWNPESGQVQLDFDVSELASEVAPLARKAAEEAREAETPLDAEDWCALAVELEACDIEHARDAYRRALELDPKHAEARVNLGRLLHEAGETVAAEAHYRIALGFNPDDTTAAFNLAVALEDLGRLSEAIAMYERVIVADPGYEDAHFNLGRLCERLGRTQAALKHLHIYRKLAQGR